MLCVKKIKIKIVDNKKKKTTSFMSPFFKDLVPILCNCNKGAFTLALSVRTRVRLTSEFGSFG